MLESSVKKLQYYILEEYHGRHAWRYFIEDYFKLWDFPSFPFKTRISIKHTLKTRQKRALSLPLGFWAEKVVELTRKKIINLLKADLKRKRKTYDSYDLFEKRTSQDSEPYILDKILLNPLFEYPPKSQEKFPRLINNKFMVRTKKPKLGSKYTLKNCTKKWKNLD